MGVEKFNQKYSSRKSNLFDSRNRLCVMADHCRVGDHQKHLSLVYERPRGRLHLVRDHGHVSTTHS